MKTIDIKSLLIACLLAVVFIGCAGEDKNGRYVDWVKPHVVYGQPRLGAKAYLLDTHTGDIYELRDINDDPKVSKLVWRKLISIE